MGFHRLPPLTVLQSAAGVETELSRGTPVEATEHRASPNRFSPFPLAQVELRRAPRRASSRGQGSLRSKASSYGQREMVLPSFLLTDKIT